MSIIISSHVLHMSGRMSAAVRTAADGFADNDHMSIELAALVAEPTSQTVMRLTYWQGENGPT
ncbi:hypothetical protein [Pseudoxanthomonas sp. UTMC 1351]|uniref:hypothetical protein n=1 Tax=Pseudoxanthomonas sp. UTMC 1351 TaxID=2695853 RepID=UPI0034CEB698